MFEFFHVCGWCHESELWQLWNFRANAVTVKINCNIYKLQRLYWCWKIELLVSSFSEGVADCRFSWFYCCHVVELLIFANCEGVADAMRLNYWQLCIWMSRLGHCDNCAVSGNSQELSVCRSCWRYANLFFFCFLFENSLTKLTEMARFDVSGCLIYGAVLGWTVYLKRKRFSKKTSR